MTGNGTVIISLAAGVAQDAAGNTSAASTNTDNTVTYDTTVPTVTSVTSSTANGSYRAGQAISIQVVFSESVTVTGTPTLTLSTGTPATTAVNYSSGSGTNTLTFTYTVAAGNTSADLDYATTGALAGTITDTALNPAVLTLVAPGAAGSLGANKALVIDTTVPTVTSVTSSTANGSYRAGQAISIQVVFSESVTVTGTPTLTLSTGTPATTAVNYSSGSGTNTLTFTYTVAAGNTSADLDYATTGALAGTITDTALNPAVLTLVAPGAAGSLGANKALVIDTTVPTVTSVTSSTANGSYRAGQAISIQVVFSESVTVTGTPTLTLSTGTPATTAVNYSSGSGTNTLTFTYTVAAGNTSADLDYATTGALALNGGTITDAAAQPRRPYPGRARSGRLPGGQQGPGHRHHRPHGHQSTIHGHGSDQNRAAISIQVVFSESGDRHRHPELTLSTGTPATRPSTTARAPAPTP